VVETFQGLRRGDARFSGATGFYLVRLYVELDKLNANERVSNLNITTDHLVAAAQRILHPYATDHLVAAAQRILHPYALKVKEIAWWSVYEIGQRLCDKFDDVPEDEAKARFPRVFIAGDACHTHSPKAGQGMNVSMQDGFNLGWKLASVLRGQSSLRILRTYSDERQAIAKELIDFDRKWARMFSAPPKDPSDAKSQGVDPAKFQKYFVRQGRFTAGTETRYSPSIVSAEPTH
jgi:2-polyprenyl-6-methoxyphenol hydroxylase-like FAD-dependent oxidoreductase